MAWRPGTKTITIGPDHEELAPELLSQRKKAESGQFRLQVDGQTKASFTTPKAAEEAGQAIKKAYPILHVAVYDTAEGVGKIIELPNR